MSASQNIPHEDRSTYLGSHDTAAIIGMSPYRKPIDVYMQKLRLVEDEEPTERMRWGLALQDAILAEFSNRMGGLFLHPEQFVRHPSLSWFGGTPDAMFEMDGKAYGVDAKNVQFNRGDWGDDGTDQVPRHILFQCHHFLALGGCAAWYVAALFGGCEMRVYKVDYDQEMTDLIVNMDGEFWREHVEREIPPEIDGSEGWRKYAERIHPKDNGFIRVATSKESMHFLDLKSVERAIKKAEQREKELKNSLIASIGDDAGLDFGEWGKLSYRLAKGRESIDTEALKKDLPDIAKRLTKTGNPVRIFRPTFTETEA